MEFTNFNVNLEEKTITLVTPYREKNPVIKCKSIGELIKEINRFSNYLLIESGLHPYEKSTFLVRRRLHISVRGLSQTPELEWFCLPIL